MRGGPTLLSGMLSGDIQIGWNRYRHHRADCRRRWFRHRCCFNNRVTDDLIVRPRIKRPEDLRGKRFGVQSIGGGGWMGVMLGLESLGLEPRRDDIRILVIGDSTVRGQALEAHLSTPRFSTAPLAARRKPKASSRWSILSSPIYRS